MAYNENSSRGDAKPRTSWRSVFAFALLPAVVTGVAPIAYSEYMRTRNELTYFQSNSLPIATPNGQSSVFALEVQNTGTTPLNNVLVRIEFEEGRIVGSSSKQLGALQTTKTSLRQFEQTEPVLHPAETIRVALLFEASVSQAPTVTVRSNEILGTEREFSESKGASLLGKATSVILFAITYVSVLAAVLLFRRKLFKLLKPRKVPNVILFTAAICGIPRIQDKIWAASLKGMHYFGAADLEQIPV